jgi:hypothetical protein
MPKKAGCPKGSVELNGQCIRVSDKKKIQAKGFKYIGPVKNSPGSHWFKSPDDIKTVGVTIGSIEGRRGGWSLGKRWGSIPNRYIHGAPPEKKVYAIFSSDVKAKDKHRVTTPPKLFFYSRDEGKAFIKRHGMKDVKVLRYY